MLTDDDDQDTGYYLKSQGEGDERQDGSVVPGNQKTEIRLNTKIIQCN